MSRKGIPSVLFVSTVAQNFNIGNDFFFYFPLCSILFALQVVYMLLNIATIWAYCVIRMFLFNCFILRLASSILLFFRETYIKFNELNLHASSIYCICTNVCHSFEASIQDYISHLAWRFCVGACQTVFRLTLLSASSEHIYI